jgi:hypothetical protein
MWYSLLSSEAWQGGVARQIITREISAFPLSSSHSCREVKYQKGFNVTYSPNVKYLEANSNPRNMTVAFRRSTRAKHGRKELVSLLLELQVNHGLSTCITGLVNGWD